MDLRFASRFGGQPRVRAHQRRRGLPGALLPAAQLGRRCVGRRQTRGRPIRPREDPHQPLAGVGRCQPDLRAGDAGVGRHRRLRAARHGRRVRAHGQVLRARHPGERRDPRRSTSSPRSGRSATSSRTRTPTAACAASHARSLIDRRVREEWAAAGRDEPLRALPGPRPAACSRRTCRKRCRRPCRPNLSRLSRPPNRN